MTVTSVSIAISILNRTEHLCLIYPHALLKVRVIYIHTLIKNSYDDIRMTFTLVPSSLSTDIRTCSELSLCTFFKKVLK